MKGGSSDFSPPRVRVHNLRLHRPRGAAVTARLDGVVETEERQESFLERVRKKCVFCLKASQEVFAMVESGDTGARICDECVWLCVDLIAQRTRGEESP